jgi:hypothetical protein
MKREPWVNRVQGGVEHCAHGVSYREICGECWGPQEQLSSNEEAFLDGNLDYGPIRGSVTTDRGVLQLVDVNEGHTLLLTVNEARALKLWLDLILPRAAVETETGNG